MEMEGLNLPDAEDLDPLTIRPERELESCNDLLDDADALKAFYVGGLFAMPNFFCAAPLLFCVQSCACCISTMS